MGWNLRKIYTRLCVVLCLVPCHFVGRFRILNEVATFIYRTEKILVKKKDTEKLRHSGSCNIDIWAEVM